MAGQTIPDGVKRAGEIQNITAEQAAEYLKCKENPEYFVETYTMIIDIDKGLVPFKMYDYQKDMLEMFHNKRWSIIAASRQSGKCVTKDMNIRVRNKHTEEIYEMTIGEFYSMCKDNQEKVINE